MPGPYRFDTTQPMETVVAELVQQPRRPLDVREEERHHSTREFAWHATIISPTSTSVEGRLVPGRPGVSPTGTAISMNLGWTSFQTRLRFLESP